MGSVDPSYERRLLATLNGTPPRNLFPKSPVSSHIFSKSSPLNSPFKNKSLPNSPRGSPQKVVYCDRFIPSRANSSRWKLDFSSPSPKPSMANNVGSSSHHTITQVNQCLGELVRNSSLEGESANYNDGSNNERSTPATAPYPAPFSYLSHELSFIDTTSAQQMQDSKWLDDLPIENVSQDKLSTETSWKDKATDAGGHALRDYQMWQCLLKNESPLAANYRDIREQFPDSRDTPAMWKNRSLLRFKEERFSQNAFPRLDMTESSRELLGKPRKPSRDLPKAPYKVLDAPDLQDDFYLNLIDWSSTNMLGVGLASCVYTWNAHTCRVQQLCDVKNEADSVCSISWSDNGQLCALGTQLGRVLIYDVKTQACVTSINAHNYRVGALSWRDDALISGSRDCTIKIWDARCPEKATGTLEEHRQEVCGLKVSPDKQYLASGGNDNTLVVWCLSMLKTCQIYDEHEAAVKAIAWSPHQHGLLASGGGTQDRKIRFWSTMTGQNLNSIDTGSQVCNLAWSIHTNELVSTHGYSQNHVIIWRYPAMEPIAKLKGHTTRVLYLAMSPCGEVICTGAGDETLRFWNIFKKAKPPKEPRSKLCLSAHVR